MGDWFAIPHGDGRFSPGIVARGTRRVLFSYVFRTIFEHVPSAEELAALRASDALWHGAMSDRAILDERWPVIRVSGFIPHAWPVVDDRQSVATPLALERLVALGIMQREVHQVVDIRAEVKSARLDALEHNVTLQWRDPLSANSLARIEAWIKTRFCAQIRLYGRALEQLPSLAAWSSLRALRIGSACASNCASGPIEIPRSASLELLALEDQSVPCSLASTLPNLRALRISGGATLDLRALHGMAQLRALDLYDVDFENFDALAVLPKLRALRLSRCTGSFGASDLAALPLHVLALEHQPGIHDLRPLEGMTALEELTLLGFWQFAIPELEWIFSLPKLRRATVDLGGRRKNVELYRRGRWATASPFERIVREAVDPQGCAGGALKAAPTGELVSR